MLPAFFSCWFCRAGRAAGWQTGLVLRCLSPLSPQAPSAPSATATASAAANPAWWARSVTAASQASTPSPKPGAGKGDCCSLKEKTGAFLKFSLPVSEWVILSPGSFRPCSCDLAGSTGECNVETGRCTCKDNVEGFHCERWGSLPVASFQEWEAFERWPEVGIGEINSLSFASSDANLDSFIWIRPIQEAVPPASVLDTLQSALVLLVTVSTASPPTSSLVKSSLLLYLKSGCRLKSEAIKKTCSFLSVQDHKPWAGRSRIPLLEVLHYCWSYGELPSLQLVCLAREEWINMHHTGASRNCKRKSFIAWERCWQGHFLNFRTKSGVSDWEGCNCFIFGVYMALSKTQLYFRWVCKLRRHLFFLYCLFPGYACFHAV